MFDALCEKKQNVVEPLLEDFIHCGGDVNVRNDDGWTLLQYAVLFDHNPAIVKLLLEKGANAKAKSNDGVPTITCVKSCCSPSCDGTGSGGNHQHTIGLPIMKLLLDSGASIDEIHPGTSFTMLHGALLDENYAFAKELLALGANPNIKNKNGDTSLKLVLRDLFINEDHHRREDQQWKQHNAFLWMLALMMLDNGGDLFAANNEGKTPFDYAQGDVEKKFLLAYSSLSTRLAKLELKVDQILAHVAP